jgi:amino acid adenylation domain-containing protein
LFVTLLSALTVLLNRLSGQDDIVVGIPSAGQSMLDGDRVLVGHCVNFLPIRTSVSSDAPMRAHLQSVKQAVLDAYDHQNYTYGKLIRKLPIVRDPSRLPLTEVQFNLEKVGTDLKFKGLEVEVDPNPKSFVNQDLFLNIIESSEGLILDCDYRTDLFNAETIERWLDHYTVLLEAMTHDLDRSTAIMPLLSETAKHQLLVEWNDTRADYPRDRLVHQLFEEQAVRTPDAIAAVFEDQKLSYAELNHRADLLAAYLQSIGVAPGSLVGVLVERSIEMLVALLAVLKAGGAYVPMDPTYPRERVSFVLKDAKVEVLLTQKKFAGSLVACEVATVCLDLGWPAISHPSRERVSRGGTTSDDLAYVIYTSGSTGKPKGVEISHRAVVNLLCSMAKKPGVTSEDVLLAVTTLSFDIAALELFLPLCVGAKLVIVSRETASDGSQLLARLDTSGATVIQATPVTFRLLIEAGWSSSPRLKVLCGGEALPRELANELLDRSKSVWNMYGPTETTIWSSANPITSRDQPITIGLPIDNTQFHVVDSHGQLAPIGTIGELTIGGDGLARGYYSRPELTAQKFVVGLLKDAPQSRLYRTGDLVRRLTDGTLEFQGRLDSQIKLRGFRIELGEIEAALLQHPGIRQAVISVHEDLPGNKRLVAYIVASQDVTVTTVREFLAGKLPDYMLPTSIVTLKALPLTPNGKIDRRALPAPDTSAATRSKEFVAPRSEQEHKLAEIWASVLHVERVGISDDLFELGADSLHIFQIASRANKAGMTIAPAMFLKHRTIAQLITIVEKNGNATPVHSTPIIARVAREKYRVNRTSLAVQQNRREGDA